jgi:hypothetical protein
MRRSRWNKRVWMIRQSPYETACGHLRRAIEFDDNLSYTEPWAWMHPPRHALAALLLDKGHLAEAERVYREDLGLAEGVQRCAQHQDNVWALHGLVTRSRKKSAAARRGVQPAALDDRLPTAQHGHRPALHRASVPRRPARSPLTVTFFFRSQGADCRSPV